MSDQTYSSFITEQRLLFRIEITLQKKEAPQVYNIIIFSNIRNNMQSKMKKKKQ